VRIRVEVSGGQEIVERMRRFGVAGVEAAVRVLNAAVERAVPMARAQSPVDDNDPEPGGELRDSIRMTKARPTKAGRLSAGVVAGGTKMADVRGREVYPLVQHEDMTLKHDEGGPKFVERPVMQVAQGIPDALYAEFDRLL
jgi:hypothetical protein